MLLGDAAHAPLPTIGQGLNMAVEDGFLLGTYIAEAMRGTQGTVTSDSGELEINASQSVLHAALTSAFSSYKKARYDKTARMVSLSRMLLALESGVTSPWLAKMRTKFMVGTMGLTFDGLKQQILDAPVVNERTKAQLVVR